MFPTLYGWIFPRSQLLSLEDCLMKSYNMIGIVAATFIFNRKKYDNFVKGWIFGSIQYNILVKGWIFGSVNFYKTKR